jgi:hypothetical protein
MRSLRVATLQSGHTSTEKHLWVEQQRQKQQNATLVSGPERVVTTSVDCVIPLRNVYQHFARQHSVYNIWGRLHGGEQVILPLDLSSEVNAEPRTHSPLRARRPSIFQPLGTRLARPTCKSNQLTKRTAQYKGSGQVCFTEAARYKVIVF